MRYFDTHSHKGYDLPGHHLSQLIVETLPNLPAPQSNLLYPNTSFLYATGLHPWFVKDLPNFEFSKELLVGHNISAIGEIGLDFFPDYLPFKQKQLILFKLNLPVSIHSRSAFPELYSLLIQYPVRGCLHGFMGSVEQAVQFTKLGFKIGINGVVCRSNANKYHRLAKECALSSLVLESDYPYVTNQQNNPLLVDSVASFIANLRQMPLDELVECTYDTASNIFKGYE